MAHEFVILRNGKQETYSNYDEIPLDFNHVIKFLPEVPPPPHTHEQHEEINAWMDKFKKLLDIERANATDSINRNTVS